MPAIDGPLGRHDVLGVEQQDAQLLALQGAHGIDERLGDVGRGADQPWVRRATARDSPAQLERRGQARRGGLGQARHAQLDRVARVATSASEPKRSSRRRATSGRSGARRRERARAAPRRRTRRPVPLEAGPTADGRVGAIGARWGSGVCVIGGDDSRRAAHRRLTGRLRSGWTRHLISKRTSRASATEIAVDGHVHRDRREQVAACARRPRPAPGRAGRSAPARPGRDG